MKAHKIHWWRSVKRKIVSIIIVAESKPGKEMSNLHDFALTSFDHNLFTQYVNLSHSGMQQDIVYRYLGHQNPKIGVLLDLSCQGTENVIRQTSRLRHFNQHYHWLLYDQYSNMTRFYDIFQNLTLSVDADIAYVVPKDEVTRVMEEKSGFMIFDVYNNGRLLGGKLNVTSNYELECNISSCSISKYHSELYKRSLYGNREALSDITLRVAVVVTKFEHTPPENINNFLMEEKDFHVKSIERLGFRTLYILVESLQAKVRYKYYDRWTNAEYTGGIVGALVNETADITSAPFYATPKRSQFLTPLASTGDLRAVCMFRTPRTSGMDEGVFLEPFSTKVWILFGVILLVSAVMLWLAFCVEYHEVKPSMRCEYIPSLLTTCIISFGSACAQGSYLLPKSIGGRLAFLCLLIVSFIMYNYYTSLVVSSLLGSPLKSKLKTVEDLTESDLDLGLDLSPYTYTYLNFSPLPDVKNLVKTKMSSRKNPQGIWYTAYEGILKMRNNPGFVFLIETSRGYQLIQQLFQAHQICDLNEIFIRSDTIVYAHLHQNSSYTEIMRLKLLRMLETGVHDKHRQDWVPTHLYCLNNNLIINVGMEYAAPLFLMLVFGYCIVLVLLILEILWKQWELRRKTI